MGFWVIVKNVALSAKCMTGQHAGNYTPIDGEPECHLEKTCPDCNKYVTKIKHNFSAWEYLSQGESECDSERACLHCGYKEREIRHDYKRAGKDSDCRIIEVCSRCQSEKTLDRKDHSWVSIFGHELKSGGKIKCKDCGEIEV